MEDTFAKYAKGKMVIQSKALDKYIKKAVCLLYMKDLRSDEYTRSNFASSRVIDALTINDDALFERQYKTISFFGKIRHGKILKKMHYDKDFRKNAKNEYKALKEEIFSPELSSMSIWEVTKALKEGTWQNPDVKPKEPKKQKKKRTKKISLEVYGPETNGTAACEPWELSGDSRQVSSTIHSKKE